MSVHFTYQKFPLVKKDQKELDLKVTAEITREQLCTRSLLSDSSVIKVTFSCNVCEHWSGHSFAVNTGPRFVVFGETLKEKTHIAITGI